MTKKSMDDITGSYDKRVFIGGDYAQRALITEMERIVSDLGFIPIVADDYDMKEEEIHDCTMRLLHNSKYAIFDISTISGALMEIERIRDYETKGLIVFSSREEKGIPKQQTTRMLDPSLHQRGYRNFTELRRIIENFLVGDEFLTSYLILCGAIEIATGKKPDTQDESFKKKLAAVNSGIRESLISYIFNKYGICSPKVKPHDFVKRIYSVIFKRSPSETEINDNVLLLTKDYRTRAQLFIDIIYSEENLQRIARTYKFWKFKRTQKIKQKALQAWIEKRSKR